MDDKDFRNLTYIISGIAVVSFIYLIYKDLMNCRYITQNLTQNQPIALHSEVQNPEVLQSIQLLKNQQDKITEQNEQLMKILKNQQGQIDYLSNIKINPQSTQAPRNSVSLSNHSNNKQLSNKINIKELSESERDKLTKKTFGML